MTSDEWLTRLEQGLRIESSEQVDRSGETVYYRVFELLRKGRKAEFNSIVGAFRLLAIAHRGEESAWWLRAANLLYALSPMSPSEKAQLLKPFEENWPRLVEARTYVLRALSDLGCPIDWSKIDGWNDVKANAPLLLVDAMIRSRRMTDAVKLIIESVARGQISNAELTMVLPRWRKQLPAHDAKLLVLSLRPQSTPAESNIWKFAEQMRTVSCVYVQMEPNHPQIPAHLAAHLNQQRMQN